MIRKKAGMLIKVAVLLKKIWIAGALSNLNVMARQK